jgi:hypothetical protein
MCLSAYHKALGDEVVLNPRPLDGCSKVCISTLFTWQRGQVEALAAHFRGHPIEKRVPCLVRFRSGWSSAPAGAWQVAT